MNLDLARWQFAITTVYHFLFVPITIGLSAMIAAYETQWLRTRNPRWLRLTKFFGKLFLINFAIGVVTGIVQEFQFGMNWSDYSRFVGDIFGAPLAVEGLLAFFLESTFLGLWIFGWDRLPPKVHAACMWVVHIGTLFSAYFILAANSWMQNPVGFAFNPETGRAEMNDFADVLFNKVQLVTFPHVVLSAYMTGAAFIAGIALWLMVKRAANDEDRGMYRSAARTAAGVVLVAGLGVAITGDVQGKIMTEVQPMKMAAAEALYETEEPAAFSIFTIGSLDGTEEKFSIKIPNVLSFLATGSTTGEVRGIDDLRAEYMETYGQDPGAAYYSPGDYVPNIPLSYWSFRLMMGLGFAAAFVGAWILWGTRRARDPGSLLVKAAIALPFLPLLANSFGWIFTEVGRQPWAVFGLMTTESAVSPGVSWAQVLTSMVLFTLLYGVLAVIEFKLLLTYISKGAEPLTESDLTNGPSAPDAPLAHAY
ncbi:cytochrome ubiquinol oxidase subunit I [Nocardioides sp.]|uniref:cytochrome ubiquinol oxidase subunit I n=1 Tax=Nocardioides sp. TaxID=35761 RepID=UPI00356B5A41